MTSYELNPKLKCFRCLRCAADYEIGDWFSGCPRCLQAGYPVSLTPEYENLTWAPNKDGHAMSRYAFALPYLSFPELGEGWTPLLESPQLAEKLGVAQLWIKNESQNPTGSHKDRMSPLIVARAHMLGCGVVAAASSGNAGISLAAYAARAGLRTIVIASHAMRPAWRRAIEKTGAELRFYDVKNRWQALRELTEKENCYPATNFQTPPTSSNPWGVQGYKTVAFEIIEQLPDCLPDVVLVPCSRGDLLWGLYRGFCEARDLGRVDRIPRLIAVEPFDRLGRVLRDGDYRKKYSGRTGLNSIDGSTTTYQSVQAVTDSGGAAIAVDTGETRQAQCDLAQAGFYLEDSATTVLPALRKLLGIGVVSSAERVLLLATSHGYKDRHGFSIF